MIHLLHSYNFQNLALFYTTLPLSIFVNFVIKESASMPQVWDRLCWKSGISRIYRVPLHTSEDRTGDKDEVHYGGSVVCSSPDFTDQLFSLDRDKLH